MKNKAYIKWVIWILASIFYFYEFILRVSPNVMVDDLMSYFSISASALGFLTSFFLYAYAPVQIPLGVLMDRIGIKKILIISCLICAFGSFIFPISHSFFIASIGRFLIGLGSAFGFISMVYVSVHWFSIKKRAFLIGLANSLAMLGASFGGGPLSVYIKKITWQNAMYTFSIFGIFLAILFFFIFKLDKQEDVKIEKASKEKKTHLLNDLKDVIKKKQSWINAFIALLLYMTTTTFAGLWGTSFIKTAYNVSNEVSSYAMSMVFIGWVIGGPLIGFISDYFGNRKNTIRIGILAVLISLLFVIYFPTIDIKLVFFLLLLIGMFSSAELLNFSLAVEINSFRAKATAAAFTNCIISLGDIIFQPLVGILLDLNYKSSVTGAIRDYTLKDYQIALSILPIALIIGFILLFYVKEPKITAN